MIKTKDDFDDEELVKVKRQRDELLKTAKDVVLQYRNFDGWVSISEIEKFEEIIEEIL
jgi:coenzyme F420-reducing hydrogenase delta subunit